MSVTDFSIQIKEGTKKSHSAAENTSFVASFLRGVVNKESYRTLITDLYYVYSAMEEEIDELQDHPIVGHINLSDLNRVESLEKDLRYYYGPIWRSLIDPSESCTQYVNRIREVAKDNPILLVGHHYTRYLGDLSGGQILKGIAKKALKLKDNHGLAFYEFDNIPDAKAYKACYKGILNHLDLDQKQVDAIIEEANYAFKLNMDMFNSLEGNWFKSLLQIFISSVFKKK